MSDEQRPKGFLSRVFGPVEDDQTSVYYSREEGDDADGEGGVEEESVRQSAGSFTVERAAEIIKHLPPEVPRSSAVRIVRQTLVAAGINLEDLASSTRERESRLESEIDQRRERIRSLREKTDEEVRRLERQILESRETRDTGISTEERRISTAREGLSDVERVREFFSLPKQDQDPETGQTSQEPQEGADAGDDTRVIDRSSYDEGFDSGGEDDTQVIRRSGPLSDELNKKPESERGEDR